MTGDPQIGRQWAALRKGARLAAPIALAGAILTPSGAPSLNIGEAANAPLGWAMLLIFAVLHVISFVAAALNYFFAVLACLVIGSLVHDVYKFRRWRIRKFITLCIGTTALVGVWRILVTHAKNDLELLVASAAPLISSVLALVLIFAVLAVLRVQRLHE